MIDPGQPPVMAPPGAMPPGAPPPMMGAPMAPAMGALFSSMANLAQSMPKTSMDKVREAVRFLEEARDEDPKLEHLSMALGVIKNGPDAIEKFTDNRSLGPTGNRATSE